MMLLPLVVGCFDYSVDLPNGFSLFSYASNRCAIADPKSNVVVLPNIEKVAVLDPYVVGYAVAVEPEGPRGLRRQMDGYFVLNTETQQVRDDLSLEEWQHTLRDEGLKARPELRTPTMWMQYW